MPRVKRFRRLYEERFDSTKFYRNKLKTNDIVAGDIWYFLGGHVHMLECLGNEPTHFQNSGAR